MSGQIKIPKSSSEIEKPFLVITTREIVVDGQPVSIGSLIVCFENLGGAVFTKQQLEK